MKIKTITALAIGVTLATTINAEYLFKQKIANYIEFSEEPQGTTFTITADNNDVYGGEQVYIVVNVEDELLIDPAEFPMSLNIQQIAFVSGDYTLATGYEVISGTIGDMDLDGIFEVMTPASSGISINYLGTFMWPTDTTWTININQ
mgnify:CR=1 FL=1